MNKQLTGIGAAVAAGMLIGGFLASYIGYFKTGVLVGGFAAYVLVDPKQFAKGVMRAWQRTCQETAHNNERLRSWKPDRRYWRVWRANTGQFWLSALGFMPGFAAIFTSIVVAFCLAMGYDITSSLLTTEAAAWVSGLSALFSMTAVCSMRDSIHVKWWRRHEEYAGVRWVGMKIALLANPATIVFTIAFFIGKGLYTLVVAEWHNIVRFFEPLGMLWMELRSALARLVGYTFAYVHTNVRTVCFVDAAIGVMLVYQFGGSFTANIIGALIGAIVAPAQYWVWCNFEPWFVERFATPAKQVA